MAGGRDISDSDDCAKKGITNSQSSLEFETEEMEVSKPEHL